MALVMIGDVWRVSLAEASDATPAQARVFVSYRPGEIVQQCLRMPTMLLPPGLDECSTISTQRSPAETAQLVTSTLFTISSGGDSKNSATQAGLDLPSLGALGHDQRCCKPCGFVHHKDGCSAGVNCSFCHLCPPGTIERQRQSKRQLIRAARRNRIEQSSTASSSSASADDTSCSCSALPSDGSATPPDLDAISQCSTADTQITEGETRGFVASKSTTSDDSHNDMQNKSTCIDVVDCSSESCFAPGSIQGHVPLGPMHMHVSATHSAAASAMAAAARVVALQKCRGALKCLNP